MLRLILGAIRRRSQALMLFLLGTVAAAVAAAAPHYVAVGAALNIRTLMAMGAIP